MKLKYRIIVFLLVLSTVFVACQNPTDNTESDNHLAQGEESMATETAPASTQEQLNELIFFPDKNFEAAVREAIGKPVGDITRDDVSGIQILDVSDREINDLAGVEHLTALNELDCSDNNISTLDVSYNIELSVFDCHGNSLSALDISRNEALTSLVCGFNEISTLDLSNNTALRLLNCSQCRIMSIDVSKNIELKTLICSGNSIFSLDLSHNNNLVKLDCMNNALRTIDISKNLMLIELNCGENMLNSLDISHNPALLSIYCVANILSALDTSHNEALLHLYCSYNKIAVLDLSNNISLIYLDCDRTTTVSGIDEMRTSVTLYPLQNESTSPTQTGNHESFYVQDHAGVMSPDLKETLINSNSDPINGLEVLCDGAQVVVVTVDYLSNYTDADDSGVYAYQLFNELGVGDANKNNGALLLLVTEEARGWLAVGTGISDSLTTDYIERNILNNTYWAYVENGKHDEALYYALSALFTWYADVYYPMVEKT